MVHPSICLKKLLLRVKVSSVASFINNILKAPPAPSHKYLKKNLEAIFIALYKPSLNDQKSFDTLMLFRNGITCFLF